MKKVLCLLFIVLMLGSVALSEAIDLTSMSDSELIELRRAIESELRDRVPITETRLYGGMYSVGSDIKAGTYNVRFVGDEHESGNLFTYESQEKFDEGDTLVAMYIDSDSPGLFLSLNDGGLLKFEYNGEAYISAVDPIG